MIAIFLFYNQAQGKQTKWILDKEFLHCNVMLNKGDGYISLEMRTNGIDHHLVPARKPMTIIRNVQRLQSVIAVICVWKKESPKVKWRPLGIRSCNEFCRFATGVDCGFTFNPVHLYKKLLKYDRKRNYEVLYTWRRSYELG